MPFVNNFIMLQFQHQTLRLVKLLCLLLVLLLFVGTPGFVSAQNKSGDKHSVNANGKKLVTPATESAINKGLEWLAKRQHKDGSFGSGTTFSQDVAVTSLCGMSFLSAGHTPQRGKYANNVKKAMEYVLSCCQANGYIIDDESKSHGPMYGHGFATMFLAEVHGMTGKKNKDLRNKISKAVKLIIASQNKKGGWRYEPEPKNADISVTVCQMMALRAARNCGVSVPKETVDRCVQYVKSCQITGGGFRYQLVRRAESRFPRSAAGVVALYSAGIYKGKEIETGLKYLVKNKPRGTVFHNQQHYHYGHYYAVQAMWHAGGEYWQRWYPFIRDELMKQQQADGSWSAQQICNEYGTAMSLLILQMPNNYLPIFQR